MNTSAFVDEAALQQLEKQRRLQILRHRIHRLRNADGRRRLLLQVDRDRFFSISVASVAIGGGIVAREEQRLLGRRDVAQDAADVGQEAHVEHPIGLVQHQVFERRELGVRRAEMIQQAAGRGDDARPRRCGTRAPAAPC